MSFNQRIIGSAYEQQAGLYLSDHQYHILEYNYRCKLGEIDIIAKNGEWLVFCEVKYRSTDVKGHPLEAVNVRKQHRIYKCAMYYMMERGIDDVPCRFDVVGILGDEVILVKDAYTYGE